MHAKVERLYGNGELIQADDGSYQVVDYHAERESLRSARASKQHYMQEEQAMQQRPQTQDFSRSSLVDDQEDADLQ